MPGNLELMEFEHDTPQLGGATTIRWHVLRPRRERAVHGRRGLRVVVIDCPPQLGYLTLGALCAATGILITIHPQMLDVASMSQFLQMTASLLEVVREAVVISGTISSGTLSLATSRTTTRKPRLWACCAPFRRQVLTHAMLKSTAISDAGLTKQTLYEVGREQFTRQTYDRALEALDARQRRSRAQVEGWGRAPA